MSEVWLPLPDYEGLYEISSLGRVRSLHKRFKAPRLLNPSSNPDGYPVIMLSKDGKRTPKTIHRLVCRAFHGEPRLIWNEAAHLDGDRRNARADNLKWASKVENMAHMQAHGTKLMGGRHGRALLTEDQAKEVIARLARRETAKSIASVFDVSVAAIEDIRRGKNWRHLPRPRALTRPLTTGNGQTGAHNHMAALTWEQAANFRRRAAQGESVRELSREFGIARANGYKLAKGETYRLAERIAQ